MLCDFFMFKFNLFNLLSKFSFDIAPSWLGISIKVIELTILLKDLKNSDIHLENLNETSETNIQTREAS